MKRCRTCGQEKALVEFSRSARSKDGYDTRCKLCDRADKQAWRANNLERARERSRQYYRKHAEENQERARDYRHKNQDQVRARERYRSGRKHVDPVKARERGRRYYARNVEKARERWQAYSERNREQLRQRARDYRAQNIDQVRRKYREWAKANPENVRVRARRRWARLRDAGPMYSPEEWQALCDHFGNVCLRCGSGDMLQADHVVPVAEGGSNDIANIQPLCPPCNTAKHTQTIDYRDPDQLACFLEGIR